MRAIVDIRSAPGAGSGKRVRCFLCKRKEVSAYDAWLVELEALDEDGLRRPAPLVYVCPDCIVGCERAPDCTDTTRMCGQSLPPGVDQIIGPAGSIPGAQGQVGEPGMG